MSKTLHAVIFVASLMAATSVALTAGATDYVVDPAHSSATFKIAHLGLSSIHGRFNEISGEFAIPAEPARPVFTFVAKTGSVDTNNAKRDEHLRSPDFFNAKQFPVVKFQSTMVTPSKTGYRVTGDLTMHGVTKSVSFDLVGGKTAEFPAGVQRHRVHVRPAAEAHRLRRRRGESCAGE